MSNAIELTTEGKVIRVAVTGKLTKEDYETLGPVLVEQIEQHGKVRILFEMHDFHGWTMSALWADMKFDFQHWNDIERLAIVGETKWEEGMATFCKPFTSAKVKYFDHTKLAEANAWITAAEA